jgi:hypothetical protein
MELLLNLVWLVIALAAIGAFRMRPGRDRRARDSQPQKAWIALACILVLLFFAISLTDDLHPELVMMEDSSWTRRHSPVLHGGSAHSSGANDCAHALVAELPGFNSLPPIALSDLAADEEATPLEPAVRAISDRGPPLLLLQRIPNTLS